MHDIFTAIWGGIKALVRRVVGIFEILAGFLQSALTWIVGLAMLLYKWIWDKIESSIGGLVDTVKTALNPSDYLSGFPVLPPLAAYWLKDVFAMDVAFEDLVLVVTIWVFFKLGRLVVVPIRALLELL